MLEVLTMRYGSLPEGVLLSMAMGTIVLGAAFAAVLLRAPSLPLSRSWFYLRVGMASFGLAAGQMLWMLYVPALKLGVSFLFMLADFGTELAFGAYVMQIARARSLDGYGHGGRAWMAFVPLVNLVLLFKASRTPDPSRGSAGAAWGGVALVALGRLATAAVDNSSDSIALQIQNDPEVQTIVQTLTLRAHGVESALDDLIAAEAAPQQIDPALLLAAVTRSGSRITYEFVLDTPDATSLDPAYRKQVHGNMCAALMPYLQQGATAAIRFARPDGFAIDELPLSVKDCTA